MASSVAHSRYVRYSLYVLVGAVIVWLLQARGGLETGAPAPHFDLPLVSQPASESARFKLDSKRDRPLLIEVFASWCGTCRRSAPALADAHAEYGAGLDFLGVSVDDSAQAALRAKRDWQIPYQVAHDERGVFAQKYRIRVLPTFILLDREGQIQEVSTGMPGRRRLAEWAQTVSK